MIKKCTILVVALALLLGAGGCLPPGGLAGPGSPGEAAKSYFEEAHLDAPVEDVKILGVEMTDKEHAIVKVRVTYGEGMSHMPSQENCKVFLEKYGDEWEIAFIT